MGDRKQGLWLIYLHLLMFDDSLVNWEGMISTLRGYDDYEDTEPKKPCSESDRR